MNNNPVKTSIKQLFWIFVVLAISNVLQGVMAPGMFTAIALVGIFYIALALFIVWFVAWATDKWDNWRGKNGEE